MTCQHIKYCLQIFCRTLTLSTLHTLSIISGNELRDDFQFFHTFDKETRDYYNMKAGDIVVFNSERFYTKHEPKFYRLDKVSQSQEQKTL